ncbi:MAG: hypothetical protein AAGI01_09585 [Myxococcota bacterium]
MSVQHMCRVRWSLRVLCVCSWGMLASCGQALGGEDLRNLPFMERKEAEQDQEANEGDGAMAPVLCAPDPGEESRACAIQGPLTVTRSSELVMFCQAPCDAIAHAVDIRDAEDITDLRAFSRIVDVDGRFTVRDTPSLQSLRGLQRVERVRRFTLSGAANLEDVTAMHGADIDTLTLERAPLLGPCAVADFLASTIPRDLTHTRGALFDASASCASSPFAALQSAESWEMECGAREDPATSWSMRATVESPDGERACLSLAFAPLEYVRAERLGSDSAYRVRAAELAPGPCVARAATLASAERLGGSVLLSPPGEDPVAATVQVLVQFPDTPTPPILEPILIDTEVILDACL